MPRYYGEGPHEMYWERDGRWYHARSNGRSFKSYEDAKYDYDAQCGGYSGSLTAVAIVSFVIFVALMVVIYE